MRILDGIASLADQYDGFILDIWGVVHDGRSPYPGVIDALARLKAAGKKVAFLSNAPRRGWFVEKQLAAMGVTGDLHDGAMTSGEITWINLRDRPDAFFQSLGDKAVHIGPERDHSTIETLPITLVSDPAEASFVLNTGPDPDLPADVGSHEAVLVACAAQKLPMVCVNPDREVMVAGQKLICAGALADRYMALGGTVREIGKPDPAAYPYALGLLGIEDRSKVLAIGDSPRTDLAGAQAAGIDVLWALTGLAAEAHGDAPASDTLVAVAKAAGVSPIAALSGLRW
ncbi:TIGR01459 family HAD-type hydrolase [Acetobacteraceae bacterium H6797]|nr:TIGR01459 family HAD-type hydrolase [Acetobacteraceae bacterium H6797]